MASAPFQNGMRSVLPLELVESLDHAYFLHLLATQPEKVVPPGKSLLSMLLHAQLAASKSAPGDPQPLLERVKEVAHKAFWDEAVESLSDPSPAIQLPRLKRLYNDLYDALKPIFPPDHRVILTLRAPLAPSSSPLHSTLAFLKELLLALKERCAPVRDKDIDELYHRLDEWHDIRLDHDDEPGTNPSSSSPLARLIAETMKSIVSLAEVMNTDLNTAILSTMPEDEVKGMVYRKAKQQERDLVLRLWSSNQEPEGQLLREKWRTWVDELPQSEEARYGTVSPETRWIPRLMMALESDVAVSCPLSPAAPSNPPEQNENPGSNATNELPPQFLFASRALFTVQNCVQALAIAAALRILSGLPVPKKGEVNEGTPALTFMDRVWTLLKLEIDAEESDKESTPDGGTKLVNLADEVIHVRRLASAPKPVDLDEEMRLRQLVDRTLRVKDPVFVLLRRRLVEAVGRQLLEQFTAPTPAGIDQLPSVMKTGRGVPGERAFKRARLRASDPDAVLPPYAHNLSEKNIPSFVIKGFEDPVLVKAIPEVFMTTLGCTQWVATVWGDLV
ncbi:hypothetical protein CC1G_06837 [Coprinopsis cinerea okayama7|uniref:Uncharacterized protein n=1 Tax=Coprinopsis cinerea (strain Okayama-7 / 130 / ATCC MYA-4618 / FGSC 9003) TaxID=240176 RepID=A8N6W5_COPC7|nr:hypothetical protein CC1G_06837 [Coprinopsis cinerea okayama7\|eukprot:XP_001830571.2 hypothetical protein CC1G_06837 [Coprinopsis cinerea okayama7\